MIRLEGDRLPDEAKGQIPPVLFGDLHEDVIGIPLQVGFSATLAQNCGIQTPDDDPPLPAGNPVIEISGPNMETIHKYVPSSGVIQIDNEWLRYSGFLTDPYRLAISERGLGATEPAQHSKGATVLFVEAKPLYVFAWNPPGHRYPANAVVRVRVNDSTQIPPHTIRIQDTRVVAGHRLLTVEFDLTHAAAGESNIVHIAGGGPTDLEEVEHRMLGSQRAGALAVRKSVDRKRKRLRRLGQSRRYRELSPIAGGAPMGVGYGPTPSTTPYTGSFPLGGVRAYGSGPQPWKPGEPLRKIPIYVPPPPEIPKPAPRPVEVRAVGLASGEPRTKPVRLLTLPLGRVTADIRGIADSATARLGEGPNTILTHPAPISKLILEETFGITTRDEVVWTATHQKQLLAGITWRFKWYGEPFESFRTRAGFCGQADLFFDEEGRAVYKLRERQVPAVATITQREIIGEVGLGWTPYKDLATRLDVTWGDVNFKGGSFVLNSPMQARFGVKRMPLDLPWIAAEVPARAVARYWLGQKDRPRMELVFGVVPPLAALTLTDRVRLSVPLAELYTKTVPFQIRGTTDRGVERILALIEADPLAKEILAYGTLSLSREYGLPAYGTLANTVDVPTLWRALLPGNGVIW
jgi:hypothetical protein